jgi:hypothetical protein
MDLIWSLIPALIYLQFFKGISICNLQNSIQSLVLPEQLTSSLKDKLLEITETYGRTLKRRVDL